MIDLGNLKIGITVESNDAKNQLNELAGTVEETGSKMSFFQKAVIGGSIAAAGTAIAKFATDAIGDYMELADAIDKGSQKLGISAEAYQE